MIAAAIASQIGSPRVTTSRLTTESNVRLTIQSAPASTGGRSSKSGAPWPGTYSPRCTSSSVVFGASRTRTPRLCAASTIASTRSSSRSCLREDQLVRALAREDLRQLLELAEQAQARLAPVSDRSDELVVDVAAPAAERAVQRRQRLSVTDEDHAPAHAGDAQQLGRSRRVGGAKEPDRDRAQGRRRRDQAGGRELVVGADPECEHDERDQDERGDHLAETGAPLAGGVEPRLPEDEHRDRREEGKPRRRPFPEEAPEDVRVPVDELAQHERRVDPEREAGNVERGERGDAEEPPAERPERRGEQRVGTARAHIRGRLDSIDLRRVAALFRELGRRGGLERHDRPL